MGMSELKHFVLYRYFHEDGTSKDWMICVEGTQYTVAFGKTNSTLQLQTKPLKKPFYDQDLVASKLRKGYVYVDDVFVDLNERKLVDSSDDSVQVKKDLTKTNLLYWSIKTNDSNSIYELDNFVKNLSSNIQEFDSSWSHPVLVKMAGSFSIAKDNVLTLLFFMAVIKQFPFVKIVDDNSIRISHDLKSEIHLLSLFSYSLEDLRPVAESIGLLNKPLEFSGIADMQDFYF